MDVTRTPLRSVHPTRPMQRPKLKPGWKHHVLYYLYYFNDVPLVVDSRDSWSSSFPWSISLDKNNN
jgi:hypothetical protein